jgi:hypothetical protein
MKIEFDAKKLTIVPIEQVRPNTWNPKDKDTVEYEKVKISIQQHGQRQPITVRENEGYEIIDGEQKWTACKELGFKDVLIYNEGVVDDKLAKELTIAYQQQVPFNELELAKLVDSIVKTFGTDVKLPYSEIQLKTFDDLANYDWEKPPEGEWQGMPEFKKENDRFVVNVSFDNEDKRKEFMKKIGATVINKTVGNIWCIWWPEKVKNDIDSIKFE